MKPADDSKARPRRWVLCLDGTWNRGSPRPGVALSNAARMARAVAPSGPGRAPQNVFYQEGIGTAGPIDRYVCGYTGWGVANKIREAYEYLAANWSPGDSIFLFGISRGAFAALTVSRLLGRYGLPASPEGPAWEEAWRAWIGEKELEGPDWVKPRVDFLGAWDTVDALGLPFGAMRRWTSPQVGARGGALGATVERAFHALACDERRIAFRPTIWQEPFPAGARVEQRWFRGVHADVCGGFGNPALADVTLAWMIERAREAGLAFDEQWLVRELRPDPAAPPSPLRVGWHRFLPFEPRRPGRTSPGSEVIDSRPKESDSFGKSM